MVARIFARRSNELTIKRATFAVLVLSTLVTVSAGCSLASKTDEGPLVLLTDCTEDLRLKETAAASKSTELVLNGEWDFYPESLSAEPPQKIMVPGSWRKIPEFAGLKNGSDARYSRGFFKKTVQVPPDCNDRAITIKLQRVSTDARVFVDGVACGAIAWPAGEVDITDKLKGKTKFELVIEVVAAQNDEDATKALLAPTTRNLDFSTNSDKLQSAGLIGDVVLATRPRGPYLSGVKVVPSVRKKNITVVLDLSGIKEAQPATVTLAAAGQNGKVEKCFVGKVELQAAQTQRLRLQAPWLASRLWSPTSPALYDLKVSLVSASAKAESNVRFGFREFWIDGRSFFLNGQQIRLRPFSLNRETLRGCAASLGTISNTIDNLKQIGFNAQEVWPDDFGIRGTLDPTAWWYQVADEKGWLMIGAGPSPKPFIKDWSGAGRDGYRKLLTDRLRPVVNHPSVIMWTAYPNASGIPPGPAEIGKELSLPRYLDSAKEAIATLAQEGVRPAFSHGSLSIGDIFSQNLYLNMTPLQEREEWFNQWSTEGTLPFMSVETGLPFEATMFRGRLPFPQAMLTEPFVSEYAASYLGDRAYLQESDAYRQALSDQLINGQSYKSWAWSEPVIFSSAYQELQAIFIRNSYRSWRTAGITGGALPWTDNAWKWRNPTRMVPIPSSQQGSRGPCGGEAIDRYAYYPQPQGGWQTQPSGAALSRYNGPALAWIAGSKQESFYDKTHNFRAGETLEKQLVIINDDFARAKYSGTCKLILNGKLAQSQPLHGDVGAFQTEFSPIKFQLGAVPPGAKVRGYLEFSGVINNRPVDDKFEITVFGTPQPTAPKVVLIDPVGKTTEMLKALKVPFSTDRTKGTSDSTIVIGRESLSQGKVQLKDYKEQVSDGATLLIMSQSPAWLQKEVGMRIDRHFERFLFRGNSDSNIAKVLDESDFSNWAGSSSLLPPRETSPKEGQQSPIYGYRWGSRGTVSSCAVEKPHKSGWRPILQCGFDQAFTPLMELNYGRGKVVLCCLDLEDHFADPAAELSLRTLLQKSNTTPNITPSSCAYTGNGNDLQFLKKELGCQLEAINASSNSQYDTLVAGSDVALTDPLVRETLKKSGTVVMLAKPPGNYGDVTVTKAAGFHGSLKAPNHPLLRGLTASDLRWRANAEANVLAPDSSAVECDGLLAVKVAPGGGKIVWVQVDPRALPVESRTYLRLTRWRQTRALCQVLANVGVTFNADAAIWSATATSDASKVPSGSGLYCADYIPPKGSDFALSDDPFRFYQW